MKRYHCRGNISKSEEQRWTQPAPNDRGRCSHQHSGRSINMPFCVIWIFSHAVSLWWRRANICIWKRLLITFFEKRILAKDESTHNCSLEAREREKKRERSSTRPPPLQPKQLSVGSVLSWRISEARLVCKIIRNEAAGSDDHCDLGVHLPFDRKSVQMKPPTYMPPVGQGTDTDVRKEPSTVRGSSFIQRYRMKGGDVTSHQILPCERKPLNDCLKRLREFE